ncbi:MAG: proprotein convertase P-domain-containing protein [Lewinellaceae bacterium]|nr:proprotein convertase P-domain-containing protein [Lewinellaceae bacterium]
MPTLNLPGNDPNSCGVTDASITAPTLACGVQLLSVYIDGAFYLNVSSGSAFTVTLGNGSYTITYQLSACDQATQTVNVVDGIKPVIACPGDVTINLAPGLCTTIFNYDVTVTDNCPFFGAPSSLTNHPTPISNTSFFNSFDGCTFDLRNDGTEPIQITGFRSFFTPAVSQTVKVWYTTSATTNVGNQTNPAAWTLLGTVQVTGNNATSFAGADVDVPVGGLVLAPGESKGLYIETQASAAMRYTNGSFTATDGKLTILSNGFAGAANFSNTFASRAFVGTVSYQSVADPTPMQTAGLASGAEYPIGTTTNCFSVSDAAGNVGTCCFNVTVNDYPNPITTLACNDLVQISLDASCSHCIGADEVLEGGPYSCYDNYIVELDKTLPLGNGPWVPGCLSASDLGKTYAVRVTDPATGNSCWGQVKVEDKLAPIVECEDLTLPCNAPSTAVGATALFNLNTAPVAIPDNQTVTGTVSVGGIPADAKVLDVNMTLDITHTWIGDLNIKLVSPDGIEMRLWGNNCGATDNIKATFDDQDPDCYNPCLNYTTGDTIQPPACLQAQFGNLNVDFLDVFLGAKASGDWQIIISDNAAGDTGNLNKCELAITYYSAQAVYQPNVIENCGAYTLTSTDTQVPGGCAQGFTNQILRKWTATDASGNTGTCVQTITFSIPTLANVVLPPDYDGIDAPFFQCAGAYPSPQWIEGQGLQGFPYIFGLPDGCTISYTYNDVVITICDGTYKILRKWDVVDWCAGEAIAHNQIVKVVDNVGPTFTCPSTMTVSTDPFTCCATVNLPDVIVTDACSQINNISWMIIGFDQYTGDTIGMFQGGGALTSFPGNNLWNPDTLGAFGYTPCLPLGTHKVFYTVEDDCGNRTTCDFRLTVRDYTPPVAACDQTTTVAIGIDDPFDCYEPSANGCDFAGVTWVKATTFDDGSYDNCGDVKFTIRRMAPYSDCILGLNPINGHPACDDIFPDFPSEFERAISELDSIKFYCCEVGTTQTVILRVYQVDVNGNFQIGPDGLPIYNECMIQVEVQDKIKPVCQSPANVTVSCENFDPSLWAYGKATVYDNCCLDSTKVYQGQKGLTHTVNYSQFDTLCNKGTIVRTFRAFDCHGFSSQCTQRIVVNYEQDYYVKFPNDVIVTECDGSGNYGEPTFFGEDCELLGVSHQDEIFTVVPDACYKIERTWTIINWCTYNPNLPCINVPNPNPNSISNHPSNLPGPTVSACGTLAPWNPTVVKINPTDPQATNYCTFWDANANCYKYKQIIKVIDNEAPIFANCPASPVEICDLTANDPLFWNDAAYWDNTISSHDLCEAPTDLCVTLTDSLRWR